MITIKSKFTNERIEINMINSMSDLELSRLGVTTIGDRSRLREKARQVLEVPGRFAPNPFSAPGRFAPLLPGRVAQSVGHLTRKSGVLGSIPGLATYFRFSFRFFKKGSCQLLAKVCARSTG